jgi:hypothetical protein
MAGPWARNTTGGPRDATGWRDPSRCPSKGRLAPRTSGSARAGSSPRVWPLPNSHAVVKAVDLPEHTKSCSTSFQRWLNLTLGRQSATCLCTFWKVSKTCPAIRPSAGSRCRRQTNQEETPHENLVQARSARTGSWSRSDQLSAGRNRHHLSCHRPYQLREASARRSMTSSAAVALSSVFLID